MPDTIMQRRLGDLKTLQDVSGQNVSQVITAVAAGDFSAETLMAFALLRGRVDDPDFTVEDAEDVSFEDAMAFANWFVAGITPDDEEEDDEVPGKS